MEFKMLRFVVEDAVAVITLDYAPTLNALDMNLALELEAALKQAEEDAAVKVVVLTGAGRAFCGGGDIRFMKAHCEEPDFADTSMGPLAGKLSEIVLYIKKMKKLVICAVAGAAAGGGCNLALGCDFVFAADNAKFLQAFVGIALIPDTSGGYMLPRAIGTHRAMDMFVTGRPVSARAVGNAVGHNPVSLIIPCHRVIGADGSLTGYAGGLERKTRLLQLERQNP